MLWNLNGVSFALCSGPNVHVGTSKSVEERGRYHLMRGGLSHAQRPPRQRLRACRPLVQNRRISCTERHEMRTPHAGAARLESLVLSDCGCRQVPCLLVVSRGRAERVTGYSQAFWRWSALISRAALIPDTIAPCIHPGHAEVCSPANHTLPSRLPISAYHSCWPA